jgi:hypothetical protein
MGRRTSGQITGLQSIGNIQASAGTLSSSQSNQDITIDPNGTGLTNINADTVITGDLTLANQGDLRLREAVGNGTNYIAQQAAANMAANYTITWPAAVSGTSGFFLASDTSGNLSWTSAAGNIAVADPGSVATVHYPFFGTNGGVLPTTLSPQARANLAFVPSTGELLHPILSGASTNSATLTIRGTSSATKATASVLMTDGVASTTTATGTLVVTGGVGVSGAINFGTQVQSNKAGGVNSPSARFGAITTSTKLDFHVNTSVGGASATNTQQYGMSFSNAGGATQAAIVCAENGSDGTAIGFFTTNSYATGPQFRSFVDPNGHFLPAATNTLDLGSTGLRWRNIYTQDLHLSNGIGDYTVVEGEENLYLVNNKTNKSFKFALIEVDASEVPAKSETT